jgi:monofunctional biosynthetic peptidoglycan transglycosylase
MKKFRSWLWRWVWRSAVIFFTLLILYQVWLFAHICWWVKYNPSTSSFMETRLEIMQDKNPKAALQYRWVPYGRISYEKNLRKGKIVAGGSTISQQLAKNLFLSTKRTPWRKLEEAAITLMLEAVMDKQRIFEIYLNIIEWGNGVFGAEAAARHYFQVSAAQLSADQAAKLAAMVPNPRYYDKHREAPGLLRKTDIIMASMNYAEIP